MIEINGVAHISLSVKRFAEAKVFYTKFLRFLGMKEVFSNPRFVYFIGGRTAVALQPADEAPADDRFLQGRVGLHHLCFRARSKEDVDRVGDFLKREGARIIHSPEAGTWAPGYYSVLFEDPDGIRLEVNYVPGKGVFESGVKFNPEGY